MNKYIRICVKIFGIICFIILLTIPFNSRIAFASILLGVYIGSFSIYALLFDKLSKWIHILYCICFFIPIIFGSFLWLYGNRNTATYNEDVVIVLGAGVIHDQVTRHLARRLDSAIYYFERNPNAYIVVTGGLGDRAIITEAEAMARYLIERGIPSEKILLEELSTNTMENLTFAYEIINERFPDEISVILISSDSHIFRAVRMARSIGMNVNQIGASTPITMSGQNYLREIVSIVYFLFFS